jgi:hypothetical protein
MTLAMADTVTMVDTGHTALLVDTTIMVVRHTRSPPFTATVPARSIRRQPMCRRQCCSLTTVQARVTGAMMDMDGAAVSTNSMTGEIGTETGDRAARFAVAGLVDGTASIDRGRRRNPVYQPWPRSRCASRPTAATRSTPL